MTMKHSGLREPMVWLVIGLPLTAVIGSLALVVAAVRSGGADAVADRVQRTGQIQTADLGPDARAAQLRLGAVVQSDAGMLRVFPAGGRFVRSETLLLTLLHPQHEAADRTIEMRPDALGWQATLALDDSHDWKVQVSDRRGSWRLRGRLSQGQRAAHLGPSLDAR